MNQTVNQGISRRNFFKTAGGTAGAVTLSAIVGCNDDKEVTYVAGTEPSQYKRINFINQEGLSNDLFLMCYKDRVCMHEPDMPVEGRLHFYEAKDSPTGPQNLINMYDAFVLSRRDSQPNTHVLRYIAHDKGNRTLTFRDYATGTREIVYNDSTNEGTIAVAGNGYRVKVDPATDQLAVDLTGEGNFTGKQAFLVDEHEIVTLEEDLLLK
jgi:hypothetical protein